MKLVCVRVCSNFICMCARPKVLKEFFTLSPSYTYIVSCFFFLPYYTNRMEPYVDHYRWTRLLSFALFPLCSVHAVHDMVSIHWFPQLCMRSMEMYIMICQFSLEKLLFTHLDWNHLENESTYIVYLFVYHKTKPERIYLRPHRHLNRKWSRMAFSFHFVIMSCGGPGIQFIWLKIHK